MNLHQLVHLKTELLESFDRKIVHSAIEENLQKLSQVKLYTDDKYRSIIESIETNHAQLINELDKNVIEITNAIETINKDIEKITAKFFTDNYQTECRFGDAATVQQYRQLPLPEGAYELLLARVRLHSTWKYPALEIGCRDGEWTKNLVGSDPLYVADEYEEFLKITNNRFPKEYQNRLRKYLIKDFNIQGLPKNQFGFIFSFNYFNYLSLDTIKQFLLQAKEWLKPGGVILFTYNNADLPASAGLCESYFMTYVPKTMLVLMIESLGFSYIDSTDILPSFSWIEIKKPGILRTVKAHQTLGEIKIRDI